MIKNIVFDMGNVLIYFDRNAFLDKVGVTDPADRQILLREVYLSLEWSMMDRGSLTDFQAAERMEKRVPDRLKKYVHALVEQWDRPILPIPGMADLVKELKQNGYSIYLLSNASFHQHDYWQEIPGHEFFDGTLISADVHLVKPQPEIYELLCKLYSLKKEETVFIDDATPNVEGAVWSGLNGIVFHDDVSELRSKLSSLGVKLATQNV